MNDCTGGGTCITGLSESSSSSATMSSVHSASESDASGSSSLEDSASFGDEEERAIRVAAEFFQNGISELGQLLVERARTLASIQYLSAHVPTWVLKRLGEEIADEESEDKRLGEEVADEESDDSSESESSDSTETLLSSSVDGSGDEESVVSDLSDEQEERDAFDDGVDCAALHHADQYEDQRERLTFRPGVRIRKPAEAQTTRFLDADPHRQIMAADKVTTSLREKIVPSSNDRNNDVSHVVDPSIELSLKAHGIGSTRRTEFLDPFAEDSSLGSEEKSLHRCEQRHVQARNASLNKTRSDISRPTPKRAQSKRRGSAASQLSCLSHRYFDNDLSLPFASRHDCAVLFVDISGFTKLSILLDPESLSKVINSYFHLIVTIATKHGGDILKFAGDAVFVEWKVSATESMIDDTELGNDLRMNSDDCITAAAICGARIVAECSNYPVYSEGDKGAEVSTLNVHCGIGIGHLVSLHVGNDERRRENIFLGDPIDQLTEAAGCALLGEVLASVEALTALARTCGLDSSLNLSELNKPAVIARHSTSLFIPRQAYQKIFMTKDVPLVSSMMQQVEGWNVLQMKQYRKLISLYVHPVVVANDAEALQNPRKYSIKDRNEEEAELRNVFTMFIAPLIKVSVSGNDADDIHLFSMLNDIMNVATRELARFSGHLRQYIVDDKGLVIIATFGLRGSTFPNMVGSRALPCAIVIHSALQSELGVLSQIGATIGNAYCGVVGGVLRHEYAVLGPSVNLAARLMASPANPGILVDDAVRMMADTSYGFNALPPVKAKGYLDRVPIFEPLSPLHRRWGRLQRNFVGRRKEIMALKSAARALSHACMPSKFVFISGESGMGKTTVVVHSIDQIRQMMVLAKKPLIVTKHVSKESDALVPFSMFRSIILDVLDSFESLHDDASFDNASSQDALGDARSVASTRSLEAPVRLVERLLNICLELGAPAHIVGEVLGLEADTLGERKTDLNNDSTLKSMVHFMSQAFQRCTQDASLVVIALDDVHQADEMSWKVVQELFEVGSSILIICTSRPLSTYTLAIGKEFWSDLNGTLKEEGRFIDLKLDRLSEYDIKKMIARTLGVDEHALSGDLVHTVFTQSHGMPQYANEILEHLKRMERRASLVAYIEGDPKSIQGSGPTFASLHELILARIDSLDANARNVLNLGAVLGHSFDLVDVVDVMRYMANDSEKVTLDQHGTEVQEALDGAVKEGVLHVVYSGGDAAATTDGISRSSNPQTKTISMTSEIQECKIGHVIYTFHHDVWRATILKLMLTSRKRDIHLTIAMVLESRYGGTQDYSRKVKMFGHWRASGNFVKAASHALLIGESFVALGMDAQSIRIYEGAVAMWKDFNSEEDEVFSGFTRSTLDVLTARDVEFLVKILIALGKAKSNIHDMGESVIAYQNALRLLREAKSGGQLSDRSVVFPIFSGLFFAIKSGCIKQDEECTYEQGLVARFVAETKMSGEEVHYIRALAMQADMYARLGDFDKALSSQEVVASIYNIKAHSAGISEAYGSDRGGQTFGAAALWLSMLRREEEALKRCRYVIEIMPEMEQRNVHNSFVMLYPVIMVMKDQFALEVRDIFELYVVKAFATHYGEGAFTFALPLHSPIMMLLDLAGHPAGEDLTKHREYVDWALEEENLTFNAVINIACGALGRVPESLAAEICFLLATRHDDLKEKEILVSNGIKVGLRSLTIAKSNNFLTTLRQLEPVLSGLESMANELKIHH
jgi:class 3 adenylate cyclase